MKCVYLLQSLSHPNQRYIGLTSDLKGRLAAHNGETSPHTSKYRPWRLRAAIWLDDHQRALDFEPYLKTDSGYAFARRHFW
jgi:predicted GIY-YIG superfamily endonuclease